MPIYEFYCSSCREKFEKILPLGHTVSRCEMCGGKADPMMSLPAVVRIAGQGVANDRTKDRIREPIWRDPVTGRVESMY